MKTQQFISYMLILIGSVLAIYAQSGVDKHIVLLIAGIVILMFGVYRISSKIPSKFDKDLDETNTDADDV